MFQGLGNAVVLFLFPLGKQNKLRVYYLSWLKAKILKGEEVIRYKHLRLWYSVTLNVCNMQLNSSPEMSFGIRCHKERGFAA